MKPILSREASPVKPVLASAAGWVQLEAGIHLFLSLGNRRAQKIMKIAPQKMKQDSASEYRVGFVNT